jgi:hypothetical protein
MKSFIPKDAIDTLCILYSVGNSFKRSFTMVRTTYLSKPIFQKIL